jgi:hypothetical protein
VTATALLLLAGTVAFSIVVVAALARRRGRAEARLQNAMEDLDVRKRQLEAANRRPRDGGELARRLRSGKF